MVALCVLTGRPEIHRSDSIQNHLRTTVADMGQVETDELYVGLDRRGAHYVIPVQAKRGSDLLTVVQIEQDFAVCDEKFPDLTGCPVGAQFMEDDLVVPFEFDRDQDGEVLISGEEPYRLVPPASFTGADLACYGQRTFD